MKEFIEKLIGRVEEEQKKQQYLFNNVLNNDNQRIVHAYAEQCYLYMSDIVKELAEEHNNKSVKGDLISKKAVITELNGIYLDNPWDDKEDILEKAIGIVDHFPTAYNNGWIPCSERLPEDCGDVICTAHLKGYEVNNTMSLWYNAKEKAWFDGDKRVDTNIIVIAWQPLPAPYQPKGE